MTFLTLPSMTNTLTSMDSFIGDVKIKVDRKILEQMLDGGDTTLPKAEDFFVEVSNKSEAIISYPRKTKLQTFGRKDPEIRVIGTPVQIQSARNLLMAAMDPHRNRVTFKMDVSHTDHSHIIGKGGKRIQSIMDSTDCHIHFPDSNRINSEEKSNQVTIAGTTIRQAEEARLLIRQSLPLTISFQLELNVGNIGLFDSSHPNIQYIQSRYCVLITFRLPEVLMDKTLATVQVRGTRMKFEDLSESVRHLFQYLNWSPIGFNNIIVTINVEIAAQHHMYVMGRGNCNVKAINDHTGAVVTFPEQIMGSPSPNTQSQNSTVTVRGRGIESAFMGWLELMGYLPIILIFDLKPEQQVDGKLMTSLMANQLISIMIRPKIRSDLKSIVIKTQEKHTNLLFEARKRILNVDEDSPIGWPTVHPKTNCGQSLRPPSGFPKFPFSADIEPEILRAFREYFNN